MTDLVQDREAIREVVARLSTAIDQLAMSQRRIIEVDTTAFGSSDSGGRTQRQVSRAYLAIQDTLSRLQSTHDEFSAQLDQVDRRLQAIDEETAADARRALADLESTGGAA